jgi:hypothetical protein
MTTTRPSLSAFQAAQASPVAQQIDAPRRKKPTAGAAEEVIQTSFRLPRSRWKRLQEVSIDERRSVQSVIVEALEEAFAKKGLKF